MQQPSTVIDIQTQNRSLYTVLQQEVDIGAAALKQGNADMAVTLFSSALQKLSPDQPFYDHLIHNLLLAYKLQIEEAFRSGDAASAKNILERALQLEVAGEMADDTMFRQRFAGAIQDLGIVFFHYRNFEASIACCRKAISIDASPSSHVNLSNALAITGGRAILSDFTGEITKEQLGRHIFIACVPKSASTFLKNLIVSLTGYRDVFMVYSPGQFEQDIYLPTLRENAHFDTVTQQHCRASDANLQVMQAFDIRPVVLVRNIFDSVLSMFDFYNNGAFFHSYFRADYQSLDDETKIDLLIDNVIPWYFQFVASWSRVEKEQRLDIHWLTYEDLIADKPGKIQNVLKFYGLGAPLGGIEQKIRETESEKRKTRFNKGVAGRGRSGLTDGQKGRITRMAKYYPSTDFSRLGL